MKSYLLTTLAFAVATASSPLWAEIQQRQLTKEVMLQFEEMDQKGDDSKEEYLIKNPHFFWMDSSATAPTIMGEIDLKGTLKVIADYKGNNIKTESDGITHIIVRSSDPDDQPMNLFIDGKINKSIDIDFKKIEGPVAQFRAGHSSDQTILSILEAISKASAEGKNLKITGDNFGTDRNPALIELVKANYVHTSGVTPEEFTLNIKSNHSLVTATPTAIYKLPNSGKIDSSYDIKTKLPAWSKLLEYTKMPHKNGLPEASFDGKMTTKSKLGEGTWDSSFASKKLEGNRYLIEGKMSSDGTNSPDWVKEVQGIEKEPITSLTSKDEDQRSESAMEKMIFDWLKSSKTTAFLTLIPLQSSLNWNGSLEYFADAGNFSVDTGKFIFSLLGKRKTGIQLNFDYKGGEANSELSLLGGRPLFDHGIALYNAFGDSIASYWRIPKFSSEDKDGLYNLFTKYSEQPGKANTELKFAVKYNKDGVTIGGKDASQFIADLSTFYHEFSSRQTKLTRPESDQIQPSGQGFDSYGVPPAKPGVDSKWPSGQEVNSPEMQSSGYRK